MSKHFYGAVLMGAILIPVSLQGCSSDNPLCCTEFKPGANIDVNIGGSAQSQVAVQAVADFSGIASAAVADLTGACQRMAADLDATSDEINAADAEKDQDARLQKMCALAVGKIKAAVAVAGTLTIAAKAPMCSASISAKASCQAKCDVSGGKCDFKAHPPKCEGGKLEVSCKGGCTASGSAEVSCTGSCSGGCTGSCTAEGGVKCAGKCEGTCEGNTTEAGAKGECAGTCKGTCSATPPKVQCSGSCGGSCDAACKGSATASVKCDGTCDGEIEPLRCTGGQLSGGCTPPDAKCEGSCDASVKAKAECTPPSVSVEFSGTADANVVGKLKATLEANLGVILAFKSRLKLMADVTGTFTANISGVADIKAACIPVVLGSLKGSATSLAGTVQVTGDITGAVGAT